MDHKYDWISYVTHNKFGWLDILFPLLQTDLLKAKIMEENFNTNLCLAVSQFIS